MPASTKATFVSACCANASNIMQVYHRMMDLYSICLANGWQSGGGDPIVNNDIPSGLGLTAAQLNSFIATFAYRWDRMMQGATLGASDTVAGQTICNIMRTDIG
jgi:hypothetical protein